MHKKNAERLRNNTARKQPFERMCMWEMSRVWKIKYQHGTNRGSWLGFLNGLHSTRDRSLFNRPNPPIVDRKRCRTPIGQENGYDGASAAVLQRIHSSWLPSYKEYTRCGLHTEKEMQRATSGLHTERMQRPTTKIDSNGVNYVPESEITVLTSVQSLLSSVSSSLLPSSEFLWSVRLM